MADKLYEQAETGCCPRFDPAPWDQKEVTFQDKLFVKDRVRSFLHIPLNFGPVMVRNLTQIQAAGALAPEPLLLSDENSLWGRTCTLPWPRRCRGPRWYGSRAPF